MSDNSTSSNSAPIVVNDSAPSFDALESILDSTPDVKLAPESNDKGTESSKTSPAKADGVEGQPKDEKTAQPPKTDGAPEAKEAKQATTEETKEAVAPEVSKELKFKVGPKGKEVALPPDAKVTIPVDGQDVEVTLEDLKRDYNGKVVYEKKFSELDKNWKAFDTDRKETEKQLNGILSKAHNKDVLGAILEMTDIAQLDPKPVFDHIRDELIGDIQKYVNMTDQERELHWARKEIEFLSRDRQSSIERNVTKQAQAELESQTTKLRETLDVSDEWMQKAKAELNVDAALAKQYLGEDTTKHLEKTVELADILRRQDMAINALSLVNENYTRNPTLVQAAMDHLGNQPRATLKTVKIEEFAKQIAEFLGVPMKTAAKTEVTALQEKVVQAKKVSESEDDSEEDNGVQRQRGSKKSEDDFSLNWDDI